MSSVTIRTRQTKSGKRYDVRFRLGGRGYPILHAGTFATTREAKIRRDLVAGEIAAGRDPSVLLEELRHPPQALTMMGAYEAFLESRVDVVEKTLRGYRNACARLGELAGKDPHRTTPADWQGWIADNEELSAGTLAVYLSAHRQVLDFVDVVPNPARSPKVKLPAAEDEEANPPSTKEWRAIVAELRKRSSLVVRLFECCALRLSEAVDLEWGDVDLAENRLRISRARTKGRRGTRRSRWIAIPQAIADELAELCPLEDRTRERRVFTLSDSVVYDDLVRACRDAGAAHYSPHDLRHRRISLWIAHGIDVVTVATWAGHKRKSMSSDVYGHVIVAGEDEWRDFWLETYAGERRLAGRPGEAAVIHEAPARESEPA